MQISDRLRATRRWTLIVMLALVPLAFRTSTFDVFNLTKFTIVLLGTLLVIGLWVVECVQRGRFLIPRTGIEPALIGVLAATAIATAFSFAKLISIFGFYKSYDGLISIFAFVTLALASAEVFDTRGQIRQGLISLAFVGGVGAVAYGVLQYVTFTTEGKTKLDWEQWGTASFKTSAIFSTFGNPNHLAGFLVMVIPIAIGIGLLAKTLWAKVFMWGFVTVAFLEILQVQTRGAWVALAFVAVGLVVVFFPEIRKHPLPVVAIAVSALLVFGIGGLVLKGRGNIFNRISSAASADDSSSRQRILLWEAGADAASKKPVFGWGPDTFRTVFLRFQGYDFYRKYGPTQVANGPHNLFVSWLYSAGIIGFAVFLWFIIAVFRRTISAARLARATERDPPKRERARIENEARSDRIILGTMGLGVLAYVVGESFNVNQIGLSFIFWTLSGLIGAYYVLIKRTSADIAEVRERAERKKASREKGGEKGSETKTTSKSAQKKPGGRPGGKKGKGVGPRRPVTERVKGATWVAAGLVLLVGIPLMWLAIQPFIADSIYRKTVPAVDQAKQAAQQLSQSQQTTQDNVSQVLAMNGEALDLANRAAKANPIESRYPFDVYEMSQMRAFLFGSGPRQTEQLRNAEKALADAQRLSPQEERFYKSMGELYAYWGGANPAPKPNADPTDPSKMRAAVDQFYQARKYDPYDYEVEEGLMKVGLALSDTAIQFDAGAHGFYLGDGPVTAALAQLLNSQGDRAGAVALLEAFIERHTNQPDVDKKYTELTGKQPPQPPAQLPPPPTGPAPANPKEVPGLPPGLKILDEQPA